VPTAAQRGRPRVDRGALIAVALMACAAETPPELPPLGEALIVVDTDLPLSVAQRLRIDIYNPGWVASRDVVLPSKSSFPVSFSVFTPNTARTATLRLRMYPEGRTRDYRDEPRVINGATPMTEPAPRTSVERFVVVNVTPGTRGRIHVMLSGECLGIEGCGDDAVTLEPDMTVPTETRVGTFPPPSTCTVEARADERCVAGALTFVGVPYGQGLIADRGIEIPAVLSPFYIDVHEVTVARFRAAIAEGFKPIAGDDDPIVNDAPLNRDVTDPNDRALCTWSSTPRDRELYPLSCISQRAARRFCQFYGGDLPTEAQWAYAAVIAGRPHRTPYPWGFDTPDCDRAVFGRFGDGECEFRQHGPVPVGVMTGDTSVALDLSDMHGNVSEWARDSFHRYYEECWTTAPLHDPWCDRPKTVPAALMGVSYLQSSLAHDHRQGANRGLRNGNVGFRCVRAGT
jgi:formylglycine-generating enzyme required for sulfatase activity